MHSDSYLTTQHPEFIMAKLSVSSIVREVLTSDPEMLTDDVIRKAKAQGLRVTDAQIRKSVHNHRTIVRAKVGATGVNPTAARETLQPKVTPAKAAPTTSAPAVTTAGVQGLTGVLKNVALVNTIVGLCGGVENARQTAEVVQACGGLEAFIQHLQLVDAIRRDEAAK